MVWGGQDQRSEGEVLKRREKLAIGCNHPQKQVRRESHPSEGSRIETSLSLIHKRGHRNFSLSIGGKRENERQRTENREDEPLSLNSCTV